jgi:hypothetical protein
LRRILHHLTSGDGNSVVRRRVEERQRERCSSVLSAEWDGHRGEALPPEWVTGCWPGCQVRSHNKPGERATKPKDRHYDAKCGTGKKGGKLGAAERLPRFLFCKGQPRAKRWHPQSSESSGHSSEPSRAFLGPDPALTNQNNF